MSTYSPAIEMFLRQKERGVGQINARTSAISSALEPFAARVAGYYAPIMSQESALGGALSGSLTATGVAQGAQLGGALQSIQAPQAAVDTYGGGAAAIGAGAGQAAGALSSADLERLHSQSTAEQVYAAALPRLAQLAGEAERRNFLAQAQQELGDLALQEAQRQAEEAQAQREWQYKLQQDAYERRQDALANRRQARLDRQKHAKDVASQRRQARLDRIAMQALAYEHGQDAIKNRQAQARINQGQARIELAKRKQGESEAEFQQRERRYRQQFNARMAAARKKGMNPDSALSAKYGYIVDHSGRPILTKNGKRIPVRTDSSSNKPDWSK